LNTIKKERKEERKEERKKKSLDDLCVCVCGGEKAPDARNMYGSPPPWNVCSPYLYVPNTHTHHWRMLHTDIMTFVKKKKKERHCSIFFLEKQTHLPFIWWCVYLKRVVQADGIEEESKDDKKSSTLYIV